jgi:alpha-glucosidase
VDNQGAHLPFNFQLVGLPWNAREISSAIDLYEGALPKEGWPNWVLGNHDQSRIASRVGAAQARVAAMLLLTLRGTPTIYYGDELGMHNVPIPEEEVQDPQGLNMPGLNLSRDPFRTPMQWDDSHNAGFTTGKPWLRLASDYKQNNVQSQKDDPDSMLSLYRRLIELRNTEPALHVGKYIPVSSEGDLIAFIREADKRFLVVLNLSHAPGYFTPTDIELKGKVVLSTCTGQPLNEVQGKIILNGDEGLLIQLSK